MSSIWVIKGAPNYYYSGYDRKFGVELHSIYYAKLFKDKAAAEARIAIMEKEHITDLRAVEFKEVESE